MLVTPTILESSVSISAHVTIAAKGDALGQGDLQVNMGCQTAALLS